MNFINTFRSEKAVESRVREKPARNTSGKGSEITTVYGQLRSTPARCGAALLFIGALMAAFGCGKSANKPASDEPPVLARPTALNDAGQVVGGIHAPDSRLPAFLYDSRTDSSGKDTGGKDTDAALETTLTVLPLPAAASWALPQGLNAQGLIAGFADRADNGTRHAVVWQNETCRWLDDQNAQSSESGGVNASGDIVGSALDAAGAYHALKWRVPSSSPPSDILPLSRLNAHPVTINDRGDVAGYMRDAQNATHLFWFRNGTVRDLGPGYNIALNNRGQAAGASLTPQGLSRACVWNEAKEGKAKEGKGKEDENARRQTTDDRSGGSTTRGGRVELPMPPGMQQSAALALNDRGQIAGRVQGVAGSAPMAVVWERGRVRNLNDLLPAGAMYALEEAIGINNAGQILCAARDKKNFRGEAALLTPVGNGWRIRMFY